MQSHWTLEIQTAIKSIKELEKILDIEVSKTDYPIFIPMNFLSKIKKLGPNSALYKQFIPNELENNESGLLDPIGDFAHLKAPGFIHRYTHRALFLPTEICPIQCRYCFRKNELQNDSFDLSFKLDAIKKYLDSHPEIEEIIFTGGDPLILSDEKIMFFGEFFSKFQNIQFIRFHTRTPIIIPSRITPQFMNTMNQLAKRFHLTMMIHTNHLEEIDQEVEDAIKKLQTLDLMLFSQSVLLKDVNNHHQTLIDLFRKLSSLKIKPYYLHHPDRVKGGMHFYLPIEEGRQIYQKLQDKLSGWMIPQYVLDVPSAHFKVPIFNAESLKFSGKIVLENAQVEIKEPNL